MADRRHDRGVGHPPLGTRLLGSRRRLSCRRVARLLHSHLDGELDEERSQRIAAHLRDCRRCGLEAETYEAIRASIRHRLPIEHERVARLQDFAARLVAGGLT
jgi:anti-sigma factor RsiW